jgi:hypothetical protein
MEDLDMWFKTSLTPDEVDELEEPQSQVPATQIKTKSNFDVSDHEDEIVVPPAKAASQSAKAKKVAATKVARPGPKAGTGGLKRTKTAGGR